MKKRPIVALLMVTALALSLVAAPAFAVTPVAQSAVIAAPAKVASFTGPVTSPITIQLGHVDATTGNITYGNFLMSVGERTTVNCYTGNIPDGLYMENATISSSDTSVVDVNGQDWYVTAMDWHRFCPVRQSMV